jgi:hypothetical protein
VACFQTLSRAAEFHFYGGPNGRESTGMEPTKEGPEFLLRVFSAAGRVIANPTREQQRLRVLRPDLHTPCRVD